MTTHYVIGIHSATRTEDGADVHLWLDCADCSILSSVIDRDMHAGMSVIEADGDHHVEERIAGLDLIDFSAALMQRFTRTT